MKYVDPRKRAMKAREVSGERRQSKGYYRAGR